MAAEQDALIENEILNRRNYNRMINTVDPPKDAAQGGFLRNDPHGPRLTEYLYQLFGGNIGFLRETLNDPRFTFKGVGDQKKVLKRSIQNIYRLYFEDYTKQLQVSRNKSPSGHSQLPAGYNFIQDTMTADCITNPHFIITIGSLLDPGSRQKTVTDAEERAGMHLTEELEGASFQLSPESALNSVLTGPITCRSDPDDNENYWEVTIPTNLGPNARNENIVIRFRKDAGGAGHPKHNAEGVNAEFMLGNDRKNEQIANILNRGNTSEEDIIRIKKWLLIKELGDTIQALILNDLFRTGRYKREDTVVGTCDSVVQYRCIVNGLGVIISEDNNAKFTFYMPNVADRATQILVNKGIIRKIIEDLEAANNRVIETIDSVIRFPRTAEGYWFNGLTWTLRQKENAIAYLGRYKKSLENIRDDLTQRLSIMSDISAIKRIAGDSLFQDHFVERNGFWRPVNPTRSLFKDGSYKFRAALFFPTLFDNESAYPNPRLQQGGQPRMRPYARRGQRYVYSLGVCYTISVVIYRVLLWGGILLPTQYFHIFAWIICIRPWAFIPFIREVVSEYVSISPSEYFPLERVNAHLEYISQVFNGIMASISGVASGVGGYLISPAIARVDATGLGNIVEYIYENLRVGLDCTPVTMDNWNATAGPRTLSRKRYHIAELIRDKIAVTLGDSQVQLQSYLNTLLEIEGCRAQLEASRNDSIYVEYYSESIAKKSLELSLLAVRLGGILDAGITESYVNAINQELEPTYNPVAIDHPRVRVVQAPSLAALRAAIDERRRIDIRPGAPMLTRAGLERLRVAAAAREAANTAQRAANNARRAAARAGPRGQRRGSLSRVAAAEAAAEAHEAEAAGALAQLDPRYGMGAAAAAAPPNNEPEEDQLELQPPPPPPPPGRARRVVGPPPRYGFPRGGGAEPDMILANPNNKIDTPGFLFAYVRRMFPELFTYGLHMKIGIAPFMETLSGLTNHYNTKDALKSMNKYLADEDDFEFDKDGLFVLATPLNTEVAEKLYNIALELVKYSELFTSIYPHVKYDKSDAVYMYLRTQGIEPFIIEDESLLSKASTIAMDTYSFGYSLEVLSNYHNKKTTDSYIFERLQNIQYYETLVENDPENPIFYHELDYFYEELANLDIIKELNEEVEKYKATAKLTYAPKKGEMGGTSFNGENLGGIAKQLSFNEGILAGGRYKKTRKGKKSNRRQTRRKR